MKKVSILALHLGYGGIEKSIVTLANTLCTRYEVEIAVCYQLYEKSVFSLNKKVKVNFLNPHLKPNHNSLKESIHSKNIVKISKEGVFAAKVLYKRKNSIVNYIKNTDADVIISTRDIFNYWLGHYGKDNVLKIGWEHNHFHNDYGYANKICNSVKGLDYLVLVSNDLERYYTNRLRNSGCMCVYIPNAIDSIPKQVSSLKNKRLVSIGRLSPEKGFLDLLKVYSKLLKEVDDWTLDIIGDGSEKASLEDYINKNNLDGKVILHGFLGKDEIDKILHKSSIYVMTSYTESFGIVLLEAMSHGIPCIAFDSAEGPREIIVSGSNGYLIKNRNMDAMATKIKDLIKSQKIRNKIGENARRSISKYTSEVVGEEWFTLIEESDIYE